MQILCPTNKTKVPLVLLFLLLKALKHWNFHRKSLRKKTQQIMRQNKKKRKHRKTNNAKCVESFIWFWRDSVAFLFLYSPVNRTWQRTKGFLPHVKGSDENLIPLATANTMYVLFVFVCGCVWKMRKMWKCILYLNVYVSKGCECKPGISLSLSLFHSHSLMKGLSL